VTKVGAGKDGVTFMLYNAPDNSPLYYGELKVAFDKKDFPSADEAMARIAEILTIDQGGAAPSAAAASVAGWWDVKGTGAQMELSPDGTFIQHGRDGQPRPGTYTVNGNSLVLTYTATGMSNTFTLQGDNVYVGSRLAWVRHADAPPPPPPPDTTPVTLKLPATYTNYQSPSDEIQLRADYTLSLQEGGQTYQGTFQVNGNSLAIKVNETANSATLDGNKLIDASGQTWILKDPSASADPVLRNEDVIKMAKAGLEESLILAKIGGSKCQFDTSTDALIQLKQSGVSPAVVRAMLAK